MKTRVAKSEGSQGRHTDNRSLAPQPKPAPDHPVIAEHAELQELVDTSPLQLAQAERLRSLFGPPAQPTDGDEPLQGKFDALQRQGPDQDEPLQGKLDGKVPARSAAEKGGPENNTGIPDRLRAGIEQLSGMDLSDVQVHRDSARPAQMKAHAYAQGNDIHLGPGQEQHLPHEAWHVVQQRQGRVQPTLQMSGVGVNDDPGLEREADAMGAKALQAKVKADGAGENSSGRTADPPVQLEGGGAKRENRTGDGADNAGRSDGQASIAGESARRSGNVVAGRSGVRAEGDTSQFKAMTPHEYPSSGPLQASSVSRTKPPGENLGSPPATAAGEPPRGSAARLARAVVGDPGAAGTGAIPFTAPLGGGSPSALEVVQREDRTAYTLEQVHTVAPGGDGYKLEKGEVVHKLRKGEQLLVDLDLFQEWNGRWYLVVEINGEDVADQDAHIWNEAITWKKPKKAKKLEEEIKVKDDQSELAEEEAEQPIGPKIDVDKVIAGPLNDAITKLEVALRAYLEHKVGSEGAPQWRFWKKRSKKLAAFRNRLKELGRGAASKEADLVLQQIIAGGDDEQPATKAYALTRTKQKVQKEVKLTVNELLKGLAGLGVEDLLPRHKTFLADLATKTAQEVVDEAAPDQDAGTLGELARNAAEAALEDAYSNTLKDAEQRARQWSNERIKAEDKGKVAKYDLKKLEEDVEEKSRELGAETLEGVLEGDSPDAALGAFGEIIDAAVPAAGDSVSLAFKLKIPIPPGTFFVELGVKGQAHRGRKGAVNAAPDTLAPPDWLEVRGDFTIGGGVQAIGMQAGFVLDFFARASAANTKKAMNILSYAVYRACASEKNKALATFWAGGKAKGMSKYDRAESWAAWVEEQAFKEGATADLGVLLKGGGAITVNEKLGVAVDVGGGLFWRWDQKTVDKVKAGKKAKAEAEAKNLPDPKDWHKVSYGDQDVAAVVEAAKAARKSKKVIVGKVAVKVGPGEIAISGAYVIGGPLDGKIMGTLKLPGGKDNGAAIADITTGVINAVRALAGSVLRRTAEKDEVKGKKGKDIGATGESLAQIPVVFRGLGDTIRDGLSKLPTKEAPPLKQGSITTGKKFAEVKPVPLLAFKSKVRLTLGFGFAPKDGKKSWVARGELSHLQAMEISSDLYIGGSSLKAEKSRAMLGIAYQGGSWKLTVLHDLPPVSKAPKDKEKKT